MKYPLAAPVLLASAAACILSGSLHPPIAGAALGWGAPACFLATTLVMIAASGNLSLSSAVLMLASLLGLANAACRDLALPDLLADGCGAAAALPPPVRPLLALAGPALLVLRHGFADPVLATWLAASAVGVVPALPVEIREVLWQPGVVSGALSLPSLCTKRRGPGTAWPLTRQRVLLAASPSDPPLSAIEQRGREAEDGHTHGDKATPGRGSHTCEPPPVCRASRSALAWQPLGRRR